MPKKTDSGSGTGLREPKVEVTEEGIRVELVGDQWVLFQKEDWAASDRWEYRSVRNDLVGFRILVEKLKDWHILDPRGNPIPFERELILRQIDALLNAQGQVDTLARVDELLDLLDENADAAAIQAKADDVRLSRALAPGGIRVSLPRFPPQLAAPLNLSFYFAYNAVVTIPLVSK